MRFRHAVLILAALWSIRARPQNVSAENIRLRPTTVPVVCNNGDIRIDGSDSNKLKVCRANVWTAVLDTTAAIVSASSAGTASTAGTAAFAATAAFASTASAVVFAGNVTIGDTVIRTAGAVEAINGQTMDLRSQTAAGTTQPVFMYSGDSDTASSGGVYVFSGSGARTDGVSVYTGDAANGTSGSVIIATGTASSTRGKIFLQDGSQGTATHVWKSTGLDGAGNWAKVAFSELSGTASIAQGGTNNGTLAVTAGGMIYTDGSKLMNMGAGSTGQFLLSAASGTPVWTTKHRLFVSHSTTMALSSTGAEIAWNTVRLDTAGGYNTANGTYTCPVTDWYYAAASVRFASQTGSVNAVSDSFGPYFYKNTTSVFGITDRFDVANCTAGEILKVKMFAEGTVPQMLANPAENHMEIIQL